MNRITIILNDQEKLALRKLSEKEYRDPRAQAGLIIRQELERLGLLKAKPDGVETLFVGTEPNEDNNNATK